MELDILGTNYQLIFCPRKENNKLDEVDGYLEPFSKKIVVCDDFLDDKMNAERLDLLKNRITRHEIVHAFFQESGLAASCDYAENEELVDWIAIQIPKMISVMQKAGAL